MANAGHIDIVRDRIDHWNDWRRKNTRIVPDFSGADLSELNLAGANLARADLTASRLGGANLSGANLSRAKLFRADLSQADLSRANLFKSGPDAAVILLPLRPRLMIISSRRRHHERPCPRHRREVPQALSR